jgi:ribosomal protein S18 acetylase RimI-like enzyme
MNIRSANPDDSLSISLLIQSVAHYFTLHQEGIGAEDFLKTISPEAIEGYIKAPNFLYLAGFIDGELAGVVAIRDNRHLYHLFIAPKFQRKSLAKKLWHEAMAESIERGNPGTFTVNSTPFAVPVYESFGFEVTGPKRETKGIAFVPMTFSLKRCLPSIQPIHY